MGSLSQQLLSLRIASICLLFITLYIDKPEVGVDPWDALRGTAHAPAHHACQTRHTCHMHMFHHTQLEYSSRKKCGECKRKMKKEKR